MTTRRKRSARSKRSAGRATSFESQTVCWVLRTLARAAKHGASARRTPYDLELLASLGVRAPAATPDKAQDRAAVHEAILMRLEALEARATAPCLASENASILGRMLGLSPMETQILALTIAFDAEEALGSSFADLRARNLSQIARHAAAVLGSRARDVEHALRRDGKLRELTLVQLTRADMPQNGPLTLGNAVCSVLLRPLQNEDDLLGHFLDRVPASSLGVADYPHLAADLDLLTRLLRGACDAREAGVNVLIHGTPGTGKTELARALTQAIGVRLDAVKLVDGDDDVRDGSARLESYALSQRILAGRRDTLLLFDEAEDAFPCSSWLTRGRSVRNKAWTNRLLEENPIPTIWVSNAIEQIDRAFIRRFDFVLEVAEPPRSVRRRVLDKHLSKLEVQTSTLDRLAEREGLSPGHVQRAGRALRLLQGSTTSGAEVDLTRVIDANLRAYAGATKSRARCDGLHYDLSLLRMDTDPALLVQGLARSRAGTLCFHGPPGTGKTALAHYIARDLDLPLLEYRASDLMSKWVGDTEQGIARMFERAARDGAVLLLDEADSFLAERSCARNSWEITQVNEMLSQMDHFEGIFICSTNLVEHLDRAALRRFAIKIRFDFLTEAQVERSFVQLVHETASASARDAIEAAARDVRRMNKLTPGDFAAVLRRSRVLGVMPTANDLVLALREEVVLKRAGSSKAIGFSG